MRRRTEERVADSELVVKDCARKLLVETGWDPPSNDIWYSESSEAELGKGADIRSRKADKNEANKKIDLLKCLTSPPNCFNFSTRKIHRQNYFAGQIVLSHPEKADSNAIKLIKGLSCFSKV
jgi:hypothetical protein